MARYRPEHDVKKFPWLSCLQRYGILHILSLFFAKGVVDTDNLPLIISRDEQLSLMEHVDCMKEGQNDIVSFTLREHPLSVSTFPVHGTAQEGSPLPRRRRGMLPKVAAVKVAINNDDHAPSSANKPRGDCHL